MWIPNSIVALIFVGTLYSLIFERVKGNHFRKKAPRRPSERKKNKLKISIFVVNYITKRE